jgi:hypothetical protein
VAGHPLRPATRRSLGEPLPHQQADRPRAHPPPPELSTTNPCGQWSYPVLATVSDGYPRVKGRLLTCYSPVRRSCTPKGLTARLACVKHAASVRPEPGSNSPLKNNTPQPTRSHEEKEIPARDRTPTIITLSELSITYQRNLSNPCKQERRTGKTNSSTFDTLLSSQGSSAHLARPLGSAWGNLTKLTGFVSACQFGFRLPVPRTRLTYQALLRALAGTLGNLSRGESLGGGRPGQDHKRLSRSCLPHPATEETLGDVSGMLQIGSSRALSEGLRCPANRRVPAVRRSARPLRHASG